MKAKIRNEVGGAKTWQWIGIRENIPVIKGMISLRKEVVLMVKDLVCGMQIDETEAAGSSTYQGKTYYFCSVPCKEKFEKGPEQFVKPE